MSWADILKEKGFGWVLEDLWYKMFSWKSNPYSIKEYLKRNMEKAEMLDIPQFKNKSRDQRALDALKWVTTNFSYETDLKNFGYIENWEDVDVMWARKKADCESLSCLLYCILRNNGINPLQLAYVYGGVHQYGDHVWVEYQADETGKWYALDPAYAPNNLTVFKYRKSVDEDTSYISKRTKVSDFNV